MITEEKIRETKELLKRGTPEGEIREELRTEGYSEEDIVKHLSLINMIWDPGTYLLE